MRIKRRWSSRSDGDLVQLRDDGALNQVLRLVGITGPNWLQNPHSAMPAIVIVATWQAVGYYMIIFMAGLSDIPKMYYEAATIDGAGPFRFFWDTLLPLSVTTIAALFVIQFIYGWNQYLWPLLITTQDSMQTIVTGIKKMLYTTDELAEWQLAMATAILAMLPPVAVVVFMQRLFVRGLVETEK